MIERLLTPAILETLAVFPAVALLGPRQAGKTTLAHTVGATQAQSVYLDLESPGDRQKLTDHEAYLSMHEQRLVILDEVQHMPALFQTLRGLIDRGRRAGYANGRFLLLGSASGELLPQSGESLARRIACMELPPLQVLELDAAAQDRVWLRGDFPNSFLASSANKSLVWRKNLISIYLERDIPSFGARIPAETLRRLWTLLAHQ
jgi:predicted AAA+ superfamily ATPase